MTQTKQAPIAERWVTISEDDFNTTTAMRCGDGVLVKSQSFEQRKIDGMNITVQVGESMVYVPNATLEQVEEETSDSFRMIWVIKAYT
jgi:hypothetical protein